MFHAPSASSWVRGGFPFAWQPPRRVRRRGGSEPRWRVPGCFTEYSATIRPGLWANGFMTGRTREDPGCDSSRCEAGGCGSGSLDLRNGAASESGFAEWMDWMSSRRIATVKANGRRRSSCAVSIVPVPLDPKRQLAPRRTTVPQVQPTHPPVPGSWLSRRTRAVLPVARGRAGAVRQVSPWFPSILRSQSLPHSTV